MGLAPSQPEPMAAPPIPMATPAPPPAPAPAPHLPAVLPVRNEPRRAEPRRGERYRDERYRDRPPRQPSTALAAILELFPGFFQVFGIGHMYAGNVAVGLIFMFGYWFVLFCNVLLLLVCIGYVTLPVCWFGTMIVSSIMAANSCRRN
jgi:hypothetical protein